MTDRENVPSPRRDVLPLDQGVSCFGANRATHVEDLLPFLSEVAAFRLGVPRFLLNVPAFLQNVAAFRRNVPALVIDLEDFVRNVLDFRCNVLEIRLNVPFRDQNVQDLRRNVEDFLLDVPEILLTVPFADLDVQDERRNVPEKSRNVPSKRWNVQEERCSGEVRRPNVPPERWNVVVRSRDVARIRGPIRTRTISRRKSITEIGGSRLYRVRKTMSTTKNSPRTTTVNVQTKKEATMMKTNSKKTAPAPTTPVATPATPAAPPPQATPTDPNAALTQYVQQSVAQLDNIEASLGGDPPLSPTQKRHAAKMRTGGAAILAQIGNLATQQGLESTALNVSDMITLIGKAQALQPMADRVAAFEKHVNDVIFKAESDALGMGLQFYALLQRRTLTDSELKTALAPVVEFFARKPKPKAPGALTKPQAKATKKAVKTVTKNAPQLLSGTATGAGTAGAGSGTTAASAPTAGTSASASAGSTGTAATGAAAGGVSHS